MYKGFLKYDGVEVINVARTMAYIKAGYGTPGVDFDDAVPIDGVPEALGQSYQTPVLDAAPWYDVERPETHGFAGVLPVDITGLPGTTQVRSLTQNIADGAVAGARRRASRTVAVTALLVGDSAASAYAGLDWLTNTLLRTCNPFLSDAPVLEGFVVKPEDLTGLEDRDAALVDHAVADDADGWVGYLGAWDGVAATFTVEAVLPYDPGVLDGGAPAGSPTGDVDGGDEDDVATQVIDGGGVNLPVEVPYARLAPPINLTCLTSYVEVTWVLTPFHDGDTVRVQFGTVDGFGEELYRDPEVQLVTAETTFTQIVHAANWDVWTPAAFVGHPGIEAHVSYKTHPVVDAAACLMQLQRNLYGLECIAGPTVTSEVTDDCDNKLLTVEWTWDGGNPYRYGALTDVVNGLPSTSNTDPISKADGVAVSYPGTITNSTLNCDPPDSTPATCAYDPSGAWFAAPPIAPAIADTTKVNHASVKRRLISIDPGVFPDHGVVSFSWVFENDSTAKHSVRVRLWQQDDPDFGTHDECSFVSEFWIAYMAPDALFFINGLGDEVNVICGGQVVPAGGVMRGPYYGAFEPPSIVCGGRYFITVDVGATEGALVVDLAMALREG